MPVSLFIEAEMPRESLVSFEVRAGSEEGHKLWRPGMGRSGRSLLCDLRTQDQHDIALSVQIPHCSHRK